MIYKYTEDNIRSLLHSVGTLEEAQLVRFFSDELQPIRVKYLLDQLALDHDITYDAKSKTYSALGVPEVVGEISNRLILAFWAVAHLGSNRVQEIMLSRYPVQFIVIAPDASTYDFTVVETAMEARVAARMFAESILRKRTQGANGTEEDDVNHVAVLRRESDLADLKQVLTDAGFDSVCVVDFETKKPHYISLG